MNTATDTRDLTEYFHERLPLTMTADLRRKLAKSKYVTFRLTEIGGIPSYMSDARHVVVRFDAGSETERTEVETSGWCGTGYLDKTRELDYRDMDYSHDRDNLYCPKSGTWVVHVLDHQRAAFESIPTGAKLIVQVKLDWHSSCNHARVGHHGDVLILKWTKGKRERRIDLATYHGPHNTARFGVSG